MLLWELSRTGHFYPEFRFQRKSQSLQGTVQGSNGHSFLPLQAYEIMCMRGRGCNWVLRLTPTFSVQMAHVMAWAVTGRWF